MKRVLVKSIYDAFDYVMDHYYPFGLEEMAVRSDRYAVISIQDTHTEGFGLMFTKSQMCEDVLTLYFDDIEKAVEGAVQFTREQANQIIAFLQKNRDVETLLIHCYGGESRSRAVGAFAVEWLGGNSEKYFTTGHPNLYVYHMLKQACQEQK